MNKNEYFSVRMGFEPKQEMQINDLNSAARAALYNVLDRFIGNMYDMEKEIKENFFNLPYNKKLENYKKEYLDIYQKEYYHIFNFAEFIYEILKKRSIIEDNEEIDEHISQFIREPYETNAEKMKRIEFEINSALDKNIIGYRFINGMFIQLTDYGQLTELAKAMATPYQNANDHIKKATQLFADRTNPDYANIIKESISAVESVANELTGEKDVTLRQAIKKLETSGTNLHPAFKEALSKLYGFTSDSAGIRHGGTGEPIQQDQATARFMLVTCSAFVNYIIANVPTQK